VNYFLHSNSFFNVSIFIVSSNRKKLSKFFFLKKMGSLPSYYFVQQKFFLDENGFKNMVF